MADPGFTGWGAPTLQVGVPTYFWPNFPEDCMKIRKLDQREGASLAPSLLNPRMQFSQKYRKLGTIFVVQGVSANVLTTQAQRGTLHPPNQPTLVVVCIMKVKGWRLQQWNESPDDVERFKQR